MSKKDFSKGKSVDIDKVVQLYTKKRMSAGEIAECLGYNMGTVYVVLHRNNVKVSKRGLFYEGGGHSEKMSRIMRVVGKRKSVRDTRRKIALRLWQDEDFVKKQLKATNISPNKAELKLDSLLQVWFPNEFKFVGNGEVWIGRANPDFINVNGNKKLIELFGNHWHRQEEVLKRINHFKKYGFDTLIIWGNELDDLKLLKEKLDRWNCNV